MSRWSINAMQNVRQSDATGQKEHIRSGQLASQFTNKTGLDAQLDRDNMVAQEKANLAKFGPGVTRFALLDGNGAIDVNAVFEADGILFRPNKNGQFYAANEAFLEEELKKEEQIRKYCKRVLKYCVNDETNKTLFGLNDPTYQAIFGTGATKASLETFDIFTSEEVAGLDCTAKYMESLLPGSSAFHASTQKLIAIIRAFMPMIRGSKQTREKDGAKGTLTPFNDAPGANPADGNRTQGAGSNVPE